MSKNLEAKRFDHLAINYAQSEVHQMSPTIQRLHTLLRVPKGISLCDVACGPGHLALSFFDVASRIVGVDPSPNMLATFRRLATERGVEVETVLASAESIPLSDERFDLVVSRLAPHHFSDIDRGIEEMARMTKPGGTVAVIDLEGDPDPTIDEFNHRLELLHDPTHVRSYTAKQWHALFEKGGLVVEVMENRLTERPGGLSLHRWCEVAASGDEAETEIRALLSSAPQSYLEALGITVSGADYLIPVRTLLLVGRKPLKKGTTIFSTSR